MGGLHVSACCALHLVGAAAPADMPPISGRVACRSGYAAANRGQPAKGKAMEEAGGQGREGKGREGRKVPGKGRKGGEGGAGREREKEGQAKSRGGQRLQSAKQMSLLHFRCVVV